MTIQTNIPAPRVPFIDERSGLMSREWYMFFISLFSLTGSGENPVSLVDVQVGPPVSDVQSLASELESSVQLAAIQSKYDEAAAAIQDAQTFPYFAALNDGPGWLERLESESGIEGRVSALELLPAQRQLSAPVFGSMYLDNAPVNIVIAAANTYTAVPSGLSASELVGMVFQSGSQLVVSSAGRYFVSWQMSLVSTGPLDEIEGSFSINGTVSATATSHQFVELVARPHSMSGCSCVRLKGGDVLGLMLNNTTDADDLTLQHAQLVVIRLGD